MTIENYDDARQAVADGTDPATAAAAVVAAMTPDEQLWCLDGDAPTLGGLAFMATDGYHFAPFDAARVERLGVPGFSFSDGPRGVVIGNGTCFPVAMARGATWDTALEERIGEAIGAELRASGATLTGAVCVNVLRHPAWGRAQETYGEDPFHVGEFGAAFTRGLQRHVMACVKHFACNSMENARFSVDIEVDEVALHEIYLPHFKRIVDEGVASVMTAYNAVNGEWCGENPALLRDVLRDEWGFEGFVISDWIFGLREAAASLNGGLDVEMPFRMVRYENLPGALERGEASWDDVRTAAEHVVATLLRFDQVLADPPSRDIIGNADHRALTREVAHRSAVVLRNEMVANEPALPLSPGSSIAVIGRLADQINLGDGGSSDVWDLHCRTVLDGISAVAATTHVDGSDLEQAAATAAASDVAVVVVGYTYEHEGEYIGRTDPSLLELFPDADEPEVLAAYEARNAELPPTVKPPYREARGRGFSRGGDRESLRLLDEDVALIRAVAAANQRTVVVMQAGSAVVCSEWADDVPALVQAWYGGAEAGPGLADVLFGAVNPSARLPFSVPHDEADLPDFDRDATSFRYDRWHGWWYLGRNSTTPAFPFGYGLSYTTFELAGATAGSTGVAITITGSVRNTGDRDGADVVQVYAELPDPDAPPRLVGFARVEVPAGDDAAFEVVMPWDRLQTRDPVGRRWLRPSGDHRLTVARYHGDPGAVILTVAAP